MRIEKRDFFDEVEDLMDKGYQVAMPVEPEEMEDIRRTMKKSIEEYKADNTKKEEIRR
ncbi:hypothetical protein [Paenibacillus oralis]|uniref:hypothetical protein n=1 Tax=Paenibacillus oralis TaxID=2490856 RepID=UPI0015AC6A92|nr:hypothetical protein [Paenibacillus oralis]